MYIKRKLNEKTVVFKNLRLAYQKSSHRYRVVVGIGGNIGDVKRRFGHLLIFLKRDKRVDLLKMSLILKNPPFGFLEQDDFFNSIIVLQTNMQPLKFLTYLQHLEKKFARKRSFANAPRTLDLDIIFFENFYVNTQKLKIPHPEWFKRESVVIPLMDICR